MSNQIEQWIVKAVESWEDEEYEAADSAISIANAFQRLYTLEYLGEEIAMMRQRHMVEVVKRARAEQELERAARRRQGNESEPW